MICLSRFHPCSSYTGLSIPHEAGGVNRQNRPHPSKPHRACVVSCWTFTNTLLKYRDDRGKPVGPSQAFTHVPFSESTSRMTDVVFSEKGKVSRAVLGQEWSHS